jgi:hypothetical protein
MESVTGKARLILAFRCLGFLGVVGMGMSACATPHNSTSSYKLVLNAPGLEAVQPEVVVLREDYSQIVDRSTWNAGNAVWPKADLTVWRIKDNFRGQQVYIHEKSLPELIRSSLPGEWITLGGGGKSENVLGTLYFQRFRWKFDIECIFIRQGIDRFSDQVEVIGPGEPLGYIVIRGWYCVGPAEPNQDAAFQRFIHSIGIKGWALP